MTTTLTLDEIEAIHTPAEYKTWTDACIEKLAEDIIKDESDRNVTPPSSYNKAIDMARAAHLDNAVSWSNAHFDSLRELFKTVEEDQSDEAFDRWACITFIIWTYNDHMVKMLQKEIEELCA